MKRKTVIITAASIALYALLVAVSFAMGGCAPDAHAPHAIRASSVTVVSFANHTTEDNRPVAFIPVFNGNPDDPLGRHPRWATDDDDAALTWLRGRVQRAFDAGFRRFVFVLPAGNPRTLDDDGTRTPMAGNQLQSLSIDRRFGIRDTTQAFKAIDATCSFGVYAGFDLDDTPDDLNFSQRHTPDFGSHLDRAAWIKQHAAWSLYGVTELWLDLASAASRRQSMVLFAQWSEDLFGMRVHGEALPRTYPDYDGSLDRALMRDTSFMALITYVRRWDPDQRWAVGAGAPQYVGVRAGDAPTRAELHSLHARGFSVVCYSSTLYDQVMAIWGRDP